MDSLLLTPKPSAVALVAPNAPRKRKAPTPALQHDVIVMRPLQQQQQQLAENDENAAPLTATTTTTTTTTTTEVTTTEDVTLRRNEFADGSAEEIELTISTVVTVITTRKVSQISAPTPVTN